MKDALRQACERLGFAAFGVAGADIAPPFAPPRVPDMPWLDRRKTVREYFPEAASVIAVLYNSRLPDSGGAPPIAAHARAADYHVVIKEKLERLAAEFPSLAPYRICVDTAPVREKPVAVAAGLGWQGRNTLLINDKIGAWGLLGLLLTAAPLPPDAPAANACPPGCDACARACPTGALDGRGGLDIPRCTAYQTIESKAETIAPTHSVYGCDLCLAACPLSRRAPANPERKPLDGQPWEAYYFVKRLGKKRLERNLCALSR
ncbi:epoxyqueuosine reductase [Alphaproteobacteria bacterium]|nr:epoxyqueuosine reductase [Alphaproteobacteria bacterium]